MWAAQGHDPSEFAELARNARERKAKAMVAVRMMEDNGWSQATVASVFGVSRPAVSKWLKKYGHPDVSEVTGEDGKVYPARQQHGEARQVPEAADYAGSAAEAVGELVREFSDLRPSWARALRSIRVDRGAASAPGWKVTVPPEHAHEAEELRSRIAELADELQTLARLIKNASAWKS